MVPWLIGLGLAAIGGALIVAYWDDIINWLSDFIPKVKEAFQKFKRNVAHAAAMFVKRVQDGYAKIMHKLYYKENGQWIEETTAKQVKESEVPPNIRRKIAAQEADITEEIEDELCMEI